LRLITPEQSRRVYPTATLLCIRPGGGRTWWAHLAFTRINIELTILRKKIEDVRKVDATIAKTLQREARPIGARADILALRGVILRVPHARQPLAPQLKSGFDPSKVMFPLVPHEPPENRLAETQDPMRQEKSPHGKNGAALHRSHLPFDADVQPL
jgi:hypothetical protein